MIFKKQVLVLFLGLSFFTLAHASLSIPVVSVDGKDLGYVLADDTPYGLLLSPALHDLPPGPHGFHVHAMPLCDHSGEAAGGHLDPKMTNKHLGPYSGNGHLGDMPVLIVNADGTATIPVLAPRLKLNFVENRALMIHEGSDNYSDTPKLGGGGKRIACGVIPAR